MTRCLAGSDMSTCVSALSSTGARRAAPVEESMGSTGSHSDLGIPRNRRSPPTQSGKINARYAILPLGDASTYARDERHHGKRHGDLPQPDLSPTIPIASPALSA